MDNDKEYIEKEIEEKNKKLMEEIEEREKYVYKNKKIKDNGDKRKDKRGDEKEYREE